MVEGIIIRNVVVHVLDSRNGKAEYSQKKAEVSAEVFDFLRKKISSLITGEEMKKCIFNGADRTVGEWIEGFNEQDMIAFSIRVAQKLYDVMTDNIDIPSADVVFVTYSIRSEMYLAILKLNYAEQFFHKSMTTDDVPVNNLIPSSQAISNGKLTEAVLVDLQDRSKVEVLEKKYLINGEKRNYLSELVLQCNTLDSEKNKYALVGRIVSKISKKHYADDPEKQLLFHACVRAGLEENKQISVGDIGTRVFSNEPEILKEYYGLTEKYHMENEVLSPKEEGIVKKLEKEHIVTDNGIEITIPSDLLQGNDHITFSSERDGSVSITIKNIERVKVRQ